MIFLLILLFVSVDLFSKVITYVFFMNTTFSIFNNLIYFKPILNTDSMSIFNGLILNIDLELGELILLNIILLISMIPIYRYLRSINFKNLYLCSVLIFLISGCISSTIDRIFWGGSLDFLLISNYIIDFKDIYIFISVIITLVYIIKNMIGLTLKSIIRKL